MLSCGSGERRTLQRRDFYRGERCVNVRAFIQGVSQAAELPYHEAKRRDHKTGGDEGHAADEQGASELRIQSPESESDSRQAASNECQPNDPQQEHACSPSAAELTVLRDPMPDAVPAADLNPRRPSHRPPRRGIAGHRER